MYHIDWFADIENSLYLCMKSYFIMVCDPFNVLLESVCWYLVENFCNCSLVILAHNFLCLWSFLVAQTVKNLSAVWGNWVQSLGWEDPWKREWLPISVFLPGEFHGQRTWVGHDWVTVSFFVWFWYQIDGGLVEWVWNCSFFCNFWE